MKKIFLASVLMIAIISCDQSTHKNNPSEIVKKDTNAATTITSKGDEKNNHNSSSVLHAGADTFSIRLQMAGLKDRKIIPLTIVSGKELFAVIHKENGNANIRINQLALPDSTFDGPFGDSLHYKIKMAGAYKIIIGPDLMATGKLNGVFNLKLWTK